MPTAINNDSLACVSCAAFELQEPALALQGQGRKHKRKVWESDESDEDGMLEAGHLAKPVPFAVRVKAHIWHPWPLVAWSLGQHGALANMIVDQG